MGFTPANAAKAALRTHPSVVRIRDEHLGCGHGADVGQVHQVGCHGAHNVAQLPEVGCQLGVELQDGSGQPLGLRAGDRDRQVLAPVGPPPADQQDLLIGEGVAGAPRTGPVP